MCNCVAKVERGGELISKVIFANIVNYMANSSYKVYGNIYLRVFTLQKDCSNEQTKVLAGDKNLLVLLVIIK